MKVKGTAWRGWHSSAMVAGESKNGGLDCWIKGVYVLSLCCWVLRLSLFYVFLY